MAKQAQQEAKTTRAIDAFRGYYRAQTRPFELPEIGLTLHFPPLTTASMQAVADRMGNKPEQVSNETWWHEKNVLLLIQQAQLEDGKKAFSFGDKAHLLSEVPYPILQKMVTAMYAAALPDAPETVEAGKDGSATMENFVSSSS